MPTDSVIASRGKSPPAARRTARFALFVAILLALFAGRPATGAATLAEAAAIRDECVAAKTSLESASEIAKPSNNAYWAALRDGRTHVDAAHRTASAAAWPAELAVQRSTLLADLAQAQSNLARLDNTKRRWKTHQIRGVLDPEISRLAGGIALLDSITPPPPSPEPAPTPPPEPAPVPQPAPTPAPPGTIPDLVAGNGFTAPTPQPDATGTGPGADAQAIARWDVVPYQTVTTKIPVGVVAFHLAGIESVDFSVNGGPWTSVTQMTQNPLTLVWEYSAYVDTAALADGLVEVRAVVRPKVGIARLLAGPYDEGAAAKGRGEHSLFLYANAHGTLPSRTVWADATAGNDATGDGTEARPFQTLGQAYYAAITASADVSGLTVRLKPGDYAWPVSWAGLKENSQYVTVAGAAGQSRSAARITTFNVERNRGLDARRVCLRNLTVDTATLGSETRGCLMWADECEFTSYGLDAYPWFLPEHIWSLGIWLTRPVIHGLGNATGEFRFMRDYEIYDVGEDAIRDLCGFAINGYVHDMRYGKPSVHSDLIQFFDGMGASGQFENVAIYGLKTRRIGRTGEGVQGLFIRNYSSVPAHRDLAFVNCDLEYAGNSQILHSVDHLLIWHCNFMPNPASATGGTLLLFDDPPDSPDTRLHNFSLRNSAVAFFSSACSTEPIVASPAGGEPWAAGNHVIVGPAVGTDVTFGGTTTTLFVDPANGDYEPTITSPLFGRLAELLIPGDVNGRERTLPDCVGANVPAVR